MSRRLPSLTALRAFEATARLGGPTRAAEELNVTQSAVSRHVRALETELKLPLFRRVHRGVVPTDEGRALAGALTRAFEQVGETIERLTRDVSALKLRVLPTIGVRWLWPRLSAFEALQPGLKLNVDILWHHMPPDDGEHDCGIRGHLGPWPEELGAPLMSERLIPVCSPDFLASPAMPATTAELARAPLLHGSTDRRDWRQWARGWSGGDFDSDHGTTFDMLDLALRAAEAGRGIAITDLHVVSDELARGTLVAPWPETVDTGYDYVFVAHATAAHPALAALRDWLVAEARATVAEAATRFPPRGVSR